MASILNDVHLSARTVRGLGFSLVILGLVLPFVPTIYSAATWKPSVETERIGPLRPEMVILPAGTFLMGSPASEPGRFDTETLQQVTLTQRFAMSRTEITQGQYFAVMGERPVNDRMDSAGNRCLEGGIGDNLPVVCVSWQEVVRFCNQLSKMEGLTPVYAIEGSKVIWNSEASGFRLPTEAEWEYAARAETRQRFAGTDDESSVCEFANVADASAKGENPSWETFECDDGFTMLAPVGSKRTNRWQLYDLTGNAWEWAWDGWDGWTLYSEASSADPKGSDGASNRVVRGGSWRDDPGNARVALRYRDEPSERYDYLGFRVARSIPSSL